MKKHVVAVAIASAVSLMGIQPASVAAQQNDQTWTIRVHIEYPDGFVYDGVIASGVPTEQKSDYLSACGQSHRFGSGSAVRFHCYPVQE